MRIARRSTMALAALVVAGGLLAACSDGGGNSLAKACELDSQCAATPNTPYCSSTGVCVGCEDSTQCSGATPVCAGETQTCRACTADSECGSGVCLASLGTCAMPSQLLYVKEAGGADTGECDDKAPCASLNYAKNRATAERNVIRVIGPLTKGAELQSKVYIDGDGSTWTADNGPIVAVTTNNADVTIEGLSIEGKNGAFVNPAVQCLQNGSLRLHQATVKFGMPAIESVCKLTMTSSKVLSSRGAIACSGAGTVTVQDSELSGTDFSLVSSNGCEVRLERNRISGNPGPRFLVDLKAPPKVAIENNLIWDSMAVASSGLSITNAPTSGTIRFNTFVNTAVGAHQGTGISCDGTASVSSNVIAWQAGTALGTNPCAQRYNAYDSNTPIGVGEGNTSATLSALFVNPATDFHLAAGSPANGLADPADKIAVDLEGKARPTTGRLDAGAYETP